MIELRNQTKHSDLGTQAQLLRARIEAEIPKPAVIMVTSAEAGDGAAFTAHTLVRSFAESGRRTAFFDATRDEGNGAAAVVWHIGGDGRGLPACVSMRTSEIVFSREKLSEFVASLRSSYEVTIIDAPAVTASNVAVALGDVVDAALVSVRVGRVAGQGDELTARILKGCKGRMLGVVATAGDAIAAFERARSAESITGETSRSMRPAAPMRRKPLPARAVTSLVLAALLLAVGNAVAASSGRHNVQSLTSIGSALSALVPQHPAGH